MGASVIIHNSVTGAIGRGGGFFSANQQPILNNVACDSSETEILLCNHTMSRDCSTGEDAVVICQGKDWATCTVSD